tara:strand:+ start:159 stop:515 length:357 start_codon:yes stop_codon:yes gene_type:complete
MALGNSFSMGQARGKAKPVLVKRTKEVRIAKDYNSVSLSPAQADTTAACAYSGGGGTFTTYYHTNAGPLPALNDIVYKDKRARNPNSFAAGFYQIDLGKSKVVIEINAIGKVVLVRPC